MGQHCPRSHGPFRGWGVDSITPENVPDHVDNGFEVTVTGTGLQHLDDSVLVINYDDSADHLDSTSTSHILNLKSLSDKEAVYVFSGPHNYGGVSAYWSGIASPKDPPRSYLVKF